VLCRRLQENASALALVRASAVNQDGRSSSLTAPNGPSQQALVGLCLAKAGLPAEVVSYVAVHGTGTPLGDPIEVGALGAALAAPRASRLTLGSNKACYGHTEGTAGITGALLAVCALGQAAAAPVVNLRNMNPTLTPRCRTGAPRRVSYLKPLASWRLGCCCSR
jgi:acyl transferase domain-containing protein